MLPKKNQNSNEKDLYSVCTLQKTKNDKIKYFEILKENPQKPYCRDITIKQTGLVESLSEFFKPETPGRKGSGFSLTTDDNGGGHVVGILRENLSDKYHYYDSNNSQLLSFSNLNEIVEAVVDNYHDVKKKRIRNCINFLLSKF